LRLSADYCVWSREREALAARKTCTQSLKSRTMRIHLQCFSYSRKVAREMQSWCIFCTDEKLLVAVLMHNGVVRHNSLPKRENMRRKENRAMI
jgi:hypothetical protein